MNRYDIAAILALNGLDNREKQKLTNAKQRELFGYVAIKGGTIRVNPDNQGEIAVLRYKHVRLFSYEEFAQAINERRQIESW